MAGPLVWRRDCNLHMATLIPPLKMNLQTRA
jgi:hypothetical protein